MPTVLRLDGLRVVIYPNDHAPAHVHVMGDDCEARFTIGEAEVALLENYGFPARTVARIKAGLAEHHSALLAAWRQIHGD
jgi:hypothetical protein